MHIIDSEKTQLPLSKYRNTLTQIIRYKTTSKLTSIHRIVLIVDSR